MNSIESIQQHVTESFSSFIASLLSVGKGLIEAIIILILGWVFAKFFAFLIGSFLKAINFNKLISKFKINELLNKVEINTTPIDLLKKATFYIVMFIFIVPAFNLIGLTLVSDAVTQGLAYLPKLFIGLLLLFIGYFICDLIRKFIKTLAISLGYKMGNYLANFAFYALLIILVITVLNHIGINTSLINMNITFIIAGMVLAFGVAYGIASKDLLASIISSFYNRTRYKVGQYVKIGEIEGEIHQIDTIFIVLKKDHSKFIIPMNRLFQENVQLIDIGN